MKRVTASLLGILLLVCQPAFATTWGSKKVVDPISGAECQVRTPMSSGSYIYEWPSKYDGVFWPHTEFMWLWYCPSSGYVSFGDDFEDISDVEKARIAAFLEQAYPAVQGKIDFTTRLWLADQIYALRDKDAEWRAWYQRVRAQLLESLAYQARRAAIPLLRQGLENRKVDIQAIIDRLVLARYLTCFDFSSGGYEEFERARGAIEAAGGSFDDGQRAYVEQLAADMKTQMDECTKGTRP